MGTLELRLDYLRSARERTALLAWLPRRTARSSSPATVFIATCRTRRGGGKFGGSASAELAILAQAVRAGCHWCDIELETASQMASADLREALAPARLLISAHDFHGLPRDLRGLAGKLANAGADVIKIATVCRTLTDVRRLLSVTQDRHNIITIPMGDQALAARILALRQGSGLTYVSVETATAPGQLSLDSVNRVYRLNRRFGTSIAGPTRRTRIYGVIGNPVNHSLSPLMQNAAFAERKIDAVYLPFEVRNLAEFVQSAKPLGISGFSVTIPHKQGILRYLDFCDPLAAEIGAVNTVVLRGARLYGYNTDYVGVLRALESRLSLRSSRVLLVGAGGAARAAAFAIARSGADVAIWARRSRQSRALARACGGRAIERAAMRREFFDAIVNCTPVGLHAGDGSPLQPGELNCRLVMEMIYRPRVTPLLRLAARRGIAVISGVEMFLGQGAAQYEIWTGERAPEKVMRSAVVAALRAEEKVSAR